MTTTIWNTAVSGDWTNAADWLGGVPIASEDAVINAKGPYTVAISSAVVAKSLTMDAAGATLSEAAGGSLTMSGRLTLDAGTIILNGANNIGGQTRLIGGALELGNAAALGTSSLTIDGGALIGTANATFSNEIDASGSFVLAAGHGDTVTFAGQTILNMNSGGTIQFGASGDDGLVIWSPLTLGVAHGGASFNVNIHAGTLRDADGSLSKVLSPAASVSIAADATLDIYGHAETINQLSGGGVVTSSFPGGALTVGSGTFSHIDGSLALTVSNSLTLMGASTYTGGTTIDKGATLFLQNSGPIGGSIADGGTLAVNFGTIMLNGAISGAGAVEMNGGTLVLNGANTYSGGTTLNGGILKVDNSAELGTGEITIAGGTLMATSAETFSNQLAISNKATFLAAQGTILTLNTGHSWSIDANSHIVFGNSKSDGVVVWDTPAGSTDGGSGSITIADGTLRASDSNFQTLLDTSKGHIGPSKHTDVAQGATLDVAGFASTIYYLNGSGVVENSGASTTVTIDGAAFAGSFSGPITLDVAGNDTFRGEAANWSTINILADAQLHLENASSSSIVFSPDSSARLNFDDVSQFTGSVTGFDSMARMLFPTLGTGLSVSYSGTATGGTLTVSGVDGSAQITMTGDYTGGSFSVKGGKSPYVVFTSNTPAASAHSDSFDFNAVMPTHVAPEASVAHPHGGHAANEIAFAHDVTEALHTHGLPLDHFAHGLFMHHAIPEALL